MAGEFFEILARGDKALMRRVLESVQRTIQASFQQDMAKPTHAEVARRFRIVENLFRELRSEHGWAIERVLGSLPVALRCKLDGVDWDPTKQRMIWAPPSEPSL